MIPITPTEDARWRPLYEALRTRPRGDVVTYEDLDAVVGDIRKDRWMVYRADRELQMADQKALVNIRGIGYRIAKAEEHLDIANSHRLRGKRQARMAFKAAESADLSQIADPAVRRAITDTAEHMRGIEARMRYIEKRTTRVEKTIKSESSTRKEVEAKTDERLARLEALIAEMADKGDSAA